MSDILNFESLTLLASNVNNPEEMIEILKKSMYLAGDVPAFWVKELTDLERRMEEGRSIYRGGKVESINGEKTK
jgi:predicted small secreted protein